MFFSGFGILASGIGAAAAEISAFEAARKKREELEKAAEFEALIMLGPEAHQRLVDAREARGQTGI